jgi:hypothetical protein
MAGCSIFMMGKNRTYILLDTLRISLRSSGRTAKEDRICSRGAFFITLLRVLPVLLHPLSTPRTLETNTMRFSLAREACRTQRQPIPQSSEYSLRLPLLEYEKIIESHLKPPMNEQLESLLGKNRLGFFYLVTVMFL